MRASHLLSIGLISAGIATGGALLAPVFAQDAGAPVAASSVPADVRWLSIPELIQRLEAAGYRDFEEVERESNGYEVKATDREGRRVEVDVHPVTGEVLKTEVKGDKRS